MTGNLYLVSTPIGNLDDITYRAVNTLNDVDLIACEDTRKSGILLKHYNINTQLLSYHNHNEKSKAEYLLNKLLNGENVALISDAGSPLISDPGYHIVSIAIKNDIKIIPIPGPNAAIASLTVSGLPVSSFVFLGFPPHKKGRNTFIKNIDKYEETVIIYESVHRIKKLLKQINTLLEYDYNLVLCRELTKKFETIYRFSKSEIEDFLPNISEKGEFVLLLSRIC